MKPVNLVAWAVLFGGGCALSHVVDNPDGGEVVVDASTRDAHLGVDGSAPLPRCPSTPAPACLRVLGTSRLALRAEELEVHGIAVHDGGGVVLVRAQDAGAAVWSVVPFDDRGQLQPPIELETTPLAGGRGGDVHVSEDATFVAAWRRSVVVGDVLTAVETRVARVGSSVEELTTRDRDQIAEMGDAWDVAIVSANASALHLARTGAERVALSDPSGAEPFWAADRPTALVARAWDDWFVVGWNEHFGDGTAATVLGSTAAGRTGSSAPLFRFRTFHDAVPLGLALHEGSVFVARFEPTTEDLGRSRIRLARLGLGLDRVEWEAGMDGWGAVAPSGLELTSWRDDVWAVWETVDERYGLARLLFVATLPTDECVAAAGQPLAVLDETVGVAAGGFAVDVSAESLWIARVSHRDWALELYEFGPCE